MSKYTVPSPKYGNVYAIGWTRKGSRWARGNKEVELVVDYRTLKKLKVDQNKEK